MEIGQLSQDYVSKRAFAKGQDDQRVSILPTGRFFSCRDIFFGVISAEISQMQYFVD